MEENKNNGELFGFDSGNENLQGVEEKNSQVEKDENNDTFEYFKPSSKEDKNINEPTYSSFNVENEPKGNNDFVFKTVPTKTKKERKHNYTFKAIVVATVIAAIVGASTGVGAVLIASNWGGKNVVKDPQINVTSPGNINLNVNNVDTTVVEAVAKKVTPSVVGIRTTVSSYNFLYGEQESSGEGSGVIYSADGYIITNYHVIQEAVSNRSENAKIKVFLSYGDDEEGYSATIVGYNISCDLAVLKINASGLTPISLSNSESLNVGQFVVAIGNPGGLQFMGSVTYGVISGLNRIISDTGIGSGVELIQTDAAINPGN